MQTSRVYLQNSACFFVWFFSVGCFAYAQHDANNGKVNKFLTKNSLFVHVFRKNHSIIVCLLTTYQNVIKYGRRCREFRQNALQRTVRDRLHTGAKYRRKQDNETQPYLVRALPSQEL